MSTFYSAASEDDDEDESAASPFWFTVPAGYEHPPSHVALMAVLVASAAIGTAAVVFWSVRSNCTKRRKIVIQQQQQQKQQPGLSVTSTLWPSTKNPISTKILVLFRGGGGPEVP